MSSIRLSENQVQIIKECFAKCFLKNDHLWLFGSRANPNAKGGDIDLYIETEYSNEEDITNAKINFLVMLKQLLGDQKIDVVIKFGNFHLSIHDVAKNEGVKLI